MRTRTSIASIVTGLILAVSAWAHSDQPDKHKPGAGHEVGSGAGDVAKGTAKGAGELGKGAAKGAGDLVTLHPIGGAAALGKGAGTAGKDVTVGTVKGSGKIVHGVGRAIKHIF